MEVLSSILFHIATSLLQWKSRTYLPSDPDFLLDYMAGIASDDSDDDFEGYLLSDDEPEGIVANK